MQRVKNKRAVKQSGNRKADAGNIAGPLTQADIMHTGGKISCAETQTNRNRQRNNKLHFNVQTKQGPQR
jgi:hypothetical protein